jgi:hypothetical protein
MFNSIMRAYTLNELQQRSAPQKMIINVPSQSFLLPTSEVNLERTVQLFVDGPKIKTNLLSSFDVCSHQD